MIPQFVWDMTEPQRKEYFRLQNKVERLKQVAAEIEADRKDDPVIGGKDLERVIITNPMVGLCHMQVCVEKDVTDKEILKVCNRKNQSGTNHGWTRILHDTEPDEFWGDITPKQCAKYPNRKHYLVVC